MMVSGSLDMLLICKPILSSRVCLYCALVQLISPSGTLATRSLCKSITVPKDFLSQSSKENTYVVFQSTYRAYFFLPSKLLSHPPLVKNNASNIGQSVCRETAVVAADNARGCAHARFC